MRTYYGRPVAFSAVARRGGRRCFTALPLAATSGASAACRQQVSCTQHAFCCNFSAQVPQVAMEATTSDPRLPVNALLALAGHRGVSRALVGLRDGDGLYKYPQRNSTALR